MTYEAYLVMAAVFAGSGLVYSLTGYKAKLYKYLNGDPDVKFDLGRISKKIALGIFLGLLAFASEEVLNGDQIIQITDPGVFVKQIMLNIGAIYTIDKLILAGKGGTKTSNTGTVNAQVVDTPPADEFEKPYGTLPPKGGQ